MKDKKKRNQLCIWHRNQNFIDSHGRPTLHPTRATLPGDIPVDSSPQAAAAALDCARAMQVPLACSVGDPIQPAGEPLDSLHCGFLDLEPGEICLSASRI